MNTVLELPRKTENGWVAIDVEMFNMDDHKLHTDATGEFACLSIAIDDDVYVIQDKNDVQAALDAVQDCVWVMHNAQFDIRQLRRYANVPPRRHLWDTMIMERILWNGYFDAFSLADLARRYLDIILDKDPRKKFTKVSEFVMTQEQLEYAAKDAHITLQVVLEQRKTVKPNHFKVWRDIDLPAMWAILDFQGFPIDEDKWLALAESNKIKRDEVDATLDFNPRSWQQIKDKFKKSFHVNLSTTGAEDLLKAKEGMSNQKAKDTIDAILESKMYSKRVGTYGKRYLDKYLVNGTIPGEFQIIGAETGRMSSKNLQQIPSRDTLEFRECFIAPEGYKLIVADYSSQEPRIACWFSKDAQLLEWFQQDKDVYIEMAWEVFNERIEKGDSRRKRMKDIILGLIYGLSEVGLENREGIPRDEGKQLLAKGMSILPGLAKWADNQKKEKSKVETAYGRIFHLNPYNSQCERNATNAPIQGTAADQMKLSLRYSHENWVWGPFGGVAVVHDEFAALAPVPYEQEVATMISTQMVRAAEEICPGVPFKAEAKICQNWAEGK